MENDKVGIQTAYEINVEGDSIHLRIINVIEQDGEEPEIQELTSHLKLRQAFAFVTVMLVKIEELASVGTKEDKEAAFGLYAMKPKKGGFNPGGTPTSGTPSIH